MILNTKKSKKKKNTYSASEVLCIITCLSLQPRNEQFPIFFRLTKHLKTKIL